MTGLSDVAVMTTACIRPYYLEQTLAAWERARGFNQIRRFCIALGASPRLDEQRKVISEFMRRVDVPVEVHEDNGKIGPWKAIADEGQRVFSDPGVGFMIGCDEDTLVAGDVLEYFQRARALTESDPRVLLINAHSRCGQGWDGPRVHDDPDADPDVVRLMPWFSPWGWATWRDCWTDVILPDWDYGPSQPREGRHPMQRGCDWGIALHTLKGYLAAVPDASRTEHIGDTEGMFSNAESLAYSKAASFRAHRKPARFRLEPATAAQLVQPTGALISVVVPTLGRAERLPAVAANIAQATQCPHEILIVAEPSDQATRDAAAAIPGARLVVNERKPCYAGAVNTAFAHMTGTYLFAGSDDLRFAPGWDVPLLQVMRNGALVGGTNDLLHPFVAQGRHATHYLIDRDYIEQTGGVPDQPAGIVLNEDYDHGCTDSEFIGVARSRGVFAPCLQSVVEHLHVEAGKSPDDATYQKGRRGIAADQALFRERQARFISDPLD